VGVFKSIDDYIEEFLSMIRFDTRQNLDDFPDFQLYSQ